ncbi:hypothetical protein H0I68_14440 [Yersinia kristensenii]|nr:hypothetical protein [Yersinia kristensenii]MBW5826244.1 hypothetical protein [Yersinia kristensenii]MBW5844499.1 hypothetical protein [Yersinia kristensenii]
MCVSFAKLYPQATKNLRTRQCAGFCFFSIKQ